MQRLVTLITWLVFLLGVILCGGGVYISLLDRKAEAVVKLFGQEVNTTAVGLGLAFLGVVLVALTFRKILELAKQVFIQEAQRPDTTFHHIAVRVYAQDGNARIAGAEVIVELPFEEKRERTGDNGIVKISYPATQSGKPVKITALAKGYQPGETRKKLVNENTYDIPLIISLNQPKSNPVTPSPNSPASVEVKHQIKQIEDLFSRARYAEAYAEFQRVCENYPSYSSQANQLAARFQDFENQVISGVIPQAQQGVMKNEIAAAFQACLARFKSEFL